MNLTSNLLLRIWFLLRMLRNRKSIQKIKSSGRRLQALRLYSPVRVPSGRGSGLRNCNCCSAPSWHAPARVARAELSLGLLAFLPDDAGWVSPILSDAAKPNVLFDVKATTLQEVRKGRPSAISPAKQGHFARWPVRWSNTTREQHSKAVVAPKPQRPLGMRPAKVSVDFARDRWKP